jgi:hypothetical protein
MFLLAFTIGLFSFYAKGQVANHLVISQAFGGGGINAGYPTNDFVELYNPTSSAVSLSAWSLQYALPLSSSWVVINLSGSVPAHAYFLIVLGTNNAGIGTALPAADLTAPTNIGSVNIKLALSSSTTAFTVTDPSGSSVDFLGTGTANGFEGAAAPAGSNTTSWLRKAGSSATASSMTPPGGADAYKGNGYDANNNSTDFVTQTSITARNSSTVVTLPLVFNGVSGSNQNNQVMVNWSVTDESDIDYYVVERCVDGSTFQDVATVNAAGGTSGSYHYSWTDPLPATGNNLYRIRAVETNGHALYSIVVDIRGRAGANGIFVYPNPVEGQSFLLHVFNQPPGVYTATLTDLSGRVIVNRTIRNTGGMVTQQLNTGAHPCKGSYLLRVSNGNTLLGSHLLFFR